jgi:hypothetical protein
MAAFCFYAQRQALNMNMLCMVDHKGLKNLSVAHASHTAACKIPLSSPITGEDDNEIIVENPYENVFTKISNGFSSLRTDHSFGTSMCKALYSARSTGAMFSSCSAVL